LKTAGQIAQKLKQVRFRHLKKELSSLLKESSENCAHNRLVQDLPVFVRVCKLDCTACGGLAADRSGTCGTFEPKHSEESIRSSLSKFFQNRAVHEIAVRFPDVASLQWALSEDDEKGPLFPTAEFLGTLFEVPVWVGSPGDAQRVVVRMERYLRAEALVGQVAGVLECDPEHVVASARTLQENLSSSGEMVESTRSLNQELRQQLLSLDEELKILQAEKVAVVPKSWWRRVFG